MDFRAASNAAEEYGLRLVVEDHASYAELRRPSQDPLSPGRNVLLAELADMSLGQFVIQMILNRRSGVSRDRYYIAEWYSTTLDHGPDLPATIGLTTTVTKHQWAARKTALTQSRMAKVRDWMRVSAYEADPIIAGREWMVERWHGTWNGAWTLTDTLFHLPTRLVEVSHPI